MNTEIRLPDYGEIIFGIFFLLHLNFYKMMMAVMYIKEYCIPITDHRIPITAYCLLITDYYLPLTNYLLQTGII